MSITLAYPVALLLLLAVPIYILVARRSRWRIPLPGARNGDLSGRGTTVLARIPDVLRILTLVTVTLAIAGPVTAGAVVEEREEGVPIVLALDISSSMLAQDFVPRDRLQVAKSTIASFVESRPGDPIGIVAFAGEALTLVPPTTHRSVLLNAIEALNVGLLEDGTAIGDGLAASINRLRHVERGSGVVVLLSDGENNRGTVDPVGAAAAARALGIRVFTVGVGSEGVARVPVGSAPVGFRYAELPVGLDEELLREIAGTTGGEYFRATDADALESIYAEIDRLVPSIVETTRRVETVEWAALLLVIGMSLIALEWAFRAGRWGALP